MKMKSCSNGSTSTSPPSSNGLRNVDELPEQDEAPAVPSSVDDNEDDRLGEASIPSSTGGAEGRRENGRKSEGYKRDASLLRSHHHHDHEKHEINGPGPAAGITAAGFSANGKMTVAGSCSKRAKQTEPEEEENSCCQRLEAHLAHFCKGTTWLSILLGQVLSILLCVCGVTNVYLVDRHNIRIPTAQNFGFYIVLATIFTTILACRPAERNLFPILRTRGWKYAIVALVDAEAKYLVCKAYQLTTLTSVQLLDCFGIPTVLSLSWLVLRIRYKVPHILGVSVSLLGICCLVWADIEDGKPLGPGKNRFLGDMLCLSGAFLHGISNVAQEFVVKTFDAVEFLGMIGLFGSFVSGTQTVVLEYGAVTSLDWAGVSTTPVALIVCYTASQTAAYLISVMVMKWSSATFFNLSLLTADFYSLIVGIYLFQIKVHSLYFVSFGLMMLGVMMFSTKPTIIASHIYKSLTREHTTTLDLEMIASGRGPTSNGCSSNRSSVNYVLQEPGRSLLEDDDDLPCGNQSILIVDKPITPLTNGNGNGHGCPMLSNKNCDVVMQTSLGGCNFTCNSSNSKTASTCSTARC